MKQRLNLKQSQRLVMLPQLLQAVRLLQMSGLELHEELQQLRADNPLLEVAEDDGAAADFALSPAPDEPAAAAPLPDNRAADGAQSPADHTVDPDGGAPEMTLDRLMETDAARFEYPHHTEAAADAEAGPDWDISAPSAESPAGGGVTDWAATLSSAEASSLKQSLQSQYRLLPASSTERTIAEYIIDCLDEGGYLSLELEEIRGFLPAPVAADLSQMEAVLAQLQTLSPAGVAARNPRECLLLQLRALEPPAPATASAVQIVAACLPQLAARDYAAIRRRCGLTAVQLEQAVGLIKTLDPHPGYRVGRARIAYTVPDILVRKWDGRWQATLNSRALPRLLVNPHYKRLVRQHRNDAAYADIKHQLQQAHCLIANIEKRNKTILAIANAIVARQQRYFHAGPKQLRPLVLRDIAAVVGLHESTVSRATMGKYMLAPRGMVEMKYFFSGRISSGQGAVVSSTAVRTLIREMIENEPADKPVSDDRICSSLNHRGFELARRTVAKYRRQMNIPPSSKRKAC